MKKTSSRRFTKIGAMSYAILLKYLAEGTRDCQELAEAVGLHVLTVYDYTKAMYKQGVIHICAWETDSLGRCNVRIYMLGKGKDAIKSKKSRIQISADWRARQKQIEMNQRMAA
jgi:predicted ArsR family transcriptional regulator